MLYAWAANDADANWFEEMGRVENIANAIGHRVRVRACAFFCCLFAGRDHQPLRGDFALNDVGAFCFVLVSTLINSRRTRHGGWTPMRVTKMDVRMHD